MIKEFVEDNLNITLGSKYKENYSVKEIVKHIDEDVQDAIKHGKIFKIEYNIRERKIRDSFMSDIEFTVLSSSRKLVINGKPTEDYFFIKKKIQEMIDEYLRYESNPSIDWSQGNFFSTIIFSDDALK